jgi:uncharacterized membrane protein YqjE
MGENSPSSAGILKTLRKLGHTGLAVLENRVELFSVEIEEQKIRLIRVLLLAGAGIFLGNAALLVVSAAIVVIAGEKARLPVLIGLSVVYAGGAAWAFLALRNELRGAPPPFEETLAELKKDGDWLDPRD